MAEVARPAGETVQSTRESQQTAFDCNICFEQAKVCAKACSEVLSFAYFGDALLVLVVSTSSSMNKCDSVRLAYLRTSKEGHSSLAGSRRHALRSPILLAVSISVSIRCPFS